MTTGETFFVVSAAVLSAVRIIYGLKARGAPVTESRRSVKDSLGIMNVAMGMIALPVIHFLKRSWIAFADYSIPGVITAVGACLMMAGIWLFWRSHVDLGRNWSVSLELREGHKLVTVGVYRRVRHPMYSAMVLWALAQALLLPNWLSGMAGMIGISVLLILRMKSEERLMLDGFGEEYRQYMGQTKRLVPGLF